MDPVGAGSLYKVGRIAGPLLVFITRNDVAIN